MEKAYTVWRAFQDQVLARVAAWVLIGATLLALVEVVRRYVFGTSFEWQQDTVTYFILGATYLYFAISQRHNAHLNVTILLEALQSLGARARVAIEVIKLTAAAISLVFMIAWVWWGIPEVRESIHYATRSESLALPLWPFLATLLVGFAFMAVTMVFQIWIEVRRLRGLPVPDDEKVVDRMPD